MTTTSVALPKRQVPNYGNCDKTCVKKHLFYNGFGVNRTIYHDKGNVGSRKVRMGNYAAAFKCTSALEVETKLLHDHKGQN